MSALHQTRRAEARRRAAIRRRQRLGLAAILTVVVAAAVTIAAFAGDSSPRPRASAASAPSAGHPASARPASPAPATRHHSSGLPALPPISPAAPGTAHLVLHGPAKPEVALTFDDGFCRACVARIIRTLARTGAHATIFPNGAYGTAWEPQATTIRRLVARGQLTVGNHTFLHHDAILESSSAFAADLAHDERWIERTFGVTARPFFRPPYGAYNGATLVEAGRQGYTQVVNWSGTVADSSPRTVGYILGAIRYWAKPGAIILMHGNYPATSVALPRILAILKSRGLRPVTLRELLG